MKVCKNCAAQLDENITVCPYCRTPFETVSNDYHYQQNYNQGYQQVNNQMYQQPYNQGYQPINNQMYQQPFNQKRTTFGDVFAAICAGIGLIYDLSLLLVITNISEFVNESLDKETIDVISGNGFLAGFSFTWLGVFAGLIALLVGLSGKKKRNNGISKFNIVSGIITLIICLIAFIKVYSYFS